jgi:hypothetical protein
MGLLMNAAAVRAATAQATQQPAARRFEKQLILVKSHAFSR